MSVHPRRKTVLLPRIAAYIGCCLLVLLEAETGAVAVWLFLGWLLALPGLTWMDMSPRAARMLAVAENVLVPLGALSLGLPGIMIAAVSFTLLLGHCNVGGLRAGLRAFGTLAAALSVALWLVPWPAWRGSTAGEIGALALVVLFALAAALLSHRQKVLLERAREEIAERADHHAALAERLARYLPPAVHRVAFEQESGTVSGSHRRWLTVCFADLAGFTALTDVAESEEVVAMLDDFYTAMAEAALARGGTLDKFIGDAVMVFFGEPSSQGREQDAQACLAMAADMQQRFTRLRQRWLGGGISRDLGLRIGVHSGWCTVGSFGKAARMEYTVIGATVNAASRLESAAVPGQVLLSRNTWLLLGREVRQCRRLGPIMAKGFAQPIEVFEYVSATEPREPLRWQGDGFAVQMDPEAADPVQIRRVLAEAQRVLDSGVADAGCGNAATADGEDAARCPGPDRSCVRDDAPAELTVHGSRG
ncbi:MAG: adenylate/guanylate cyclase domain-containing protein [Gammaproteobacteria bacterium]|nr:adenylate/guanylate cyclase domain-containing protein [Gammaproteobacteria bacterium]